MKKEKKKMKKVNLFKLILIVIALPVLLFVSQVHAYPVLSTFDSDSDGWISFNNGAENVVWTASGGNPDGHIRLTDLTSSWGYFQAPAKYLGDAEYGGGFSFALRVVNSDPINFPQIYDVRTALVGNGLFLLNELPTVPSTTSWTNYVFSLDETAAAGWRSFSNLSQNYTTSAPLVTQAQFIGVLNNLTHVLISADYSDGFLNLTPPITDQAWIDSVQLDAVDIIVPEPGTMVLFGIGLTGLIMYNVRRKKQRQRKLVEIHA
jgi:hypothetical protein